MGITSPDRNQPMEQRIEFSPTNVEGNAGGVLKTRVIYGVVLFENDSGLSESYLFLTAAIPQNGYHSTLL
jgi:hypothetical protein